MRILLLKNIDPSFDVYFAILNAQGHEAEILLAHGPLSDIQNSINRFKPDLILLNNTDCLSPVGRADAHELEHLLNTSGVPVSVWDYEAPYFVGGSWLMERWRTGDYFRNFLFFNIDSYIVEEYRKKNNHCYFLPFGVDPRMQDHSWVKNTTSQFTHDLVYIGTAYWNDQTCPEIGNQRAALVETFFMDFLKDIAKRIHFCLKDFPHTDQLTQNLVSSFANFSAEVFDANKHDVFEFWQEMKKVESQLKVHFGPFLSRNPAVLDLLMGRLAVASSYYQVARRLDFLIDYGLRIYGEGAWNKIYPHYPHETKKLSYPEMYSCWKNSKIIFCYTKKLFLHNVHERIFHILGAGGFPLTDWRKDIDSLFNSDELISYRSWDEALSHIDFYLKNETARMEVVSKGRDRVFAEHTYTHRLQTLLELSARHFGFSAVPHRSKVVISSSEWVNPDWAENLSHVAKV